WDADGTRYLYLLGGIAVNALGHGHPALVAAVTDQLRTLGHVSNFFASRPQVELAEKLLSLLGLDRDPDGGPGGKVFFSNSGAEVQSGMGRPGAWTAHEGSGVVPDVVTLAKGLGGGIPIGATVAVGEAATLLQPGNHGTTFGGNPVAAAAALAVIATIEADGLLDNALKVGDVFRDGLADHPLVVETTGRGLLVGIVLAEPVTAEVQKAALAAG